MIQFLSKFPGKKTNRLIMIAGLIIFIPFYSYNYQLITKAMNMETLTKLLTCFNYSEFRDIILTINQHGNINTLFMTYAVNIISTIGFMLFGFSLTLIIARSIRQNSFLQKTGFVFPVIIIIIALLDIISSFIFLYIAKYINDISVCSVYIIDFCYMARISLIYISALWILFACIYLIIYKLKNRKNISTQYP